MPRPTACSIPMTPWPTLRFPKASIRPCSATTIASLRPTTPTRAATFRRSRTSFGPRFPASASRTVSASPRSRRRPNISPITGCYDTRAQAEPAINLARAMLPPLDKLAAWCRSGTRERGPRNARGHSTGPRASACRPRDAHRRRQQQAMTELDDRIVRYAVTIPSSRCPMAIRYMEKQGRRSASSSCCRWFAASVGSPPNRGRFRPPTSR